MNLPKELYWLAIAAGAIGGLKIAYHLFWKKTIDAKMKKLRDKLTAEPPPRRRKP